MQIDKKNIFIFYYYYYYKKFKNTKNVFVFVHTAKFRDFSIHIFRKKYVASFSYFETKIGYRNRFMIIRWNLAKISKIILNIFVLSIMV